MRSRLVLVLAMLLSACAGPDPAFEDARARSRLEAQALIGKDYIFTAPAWVCRGEDQSAVTAQLINPGCRRASGGMRFRVEDVVVRKNDGRPLLRIAGPDIAGFMPYEFYLPKPYLPAQEYFPTGK